MIAVAVLGFFFSDDISQRLQAQLAGFVGEDAAKVVLAGIQATDEKRGVIASAIGIAILLFGATGVFAELQDALNTIWGVRPKESGVKGLIRGRFTSFTMVLGTCFLLLISLIVTAIVAAASNILTSWIPGGEALGHTLEIIASVAVTTLLFAMIFKLLPDVEIRWADVWVGALVTSLLFTAGKFVIGTYIGKAGVGSGYGAAGSIIILITWIYYSAQILFFGAEFTHIYALKRGSHIVPKPAAELLETARGPQ
jgi:membrane protein